MEKKVYSESLRRNQEYLFCHLIVKAMFILTKEYHYAVERETIEVISGGIDKDEDKRDAAKRELKEETGILANELIDLGVLHYNV